MHAMFDDGVQLRRANWKLRLLTLVGAYGLAITVAAAFSPLSH